VEGRQQGQAVHIEGVSDKRSILGPCCLPSTPVLCLLLPAVPGIDMCNHSSTAPNAAVRMLHSPGACQGLAALEEVAPTAAQAACGSYFQLLAGGRSV
jgi:hypothetical protein